MKEIEFSNGISLFASFFETKGDFTSVELATELHTSNIKCLMNKHQKCLNLLPVAKLPYLNSSCFQIGVLHSLET